MQKQEVTDELFYGEEEVEIASLKAQSSESINYYQIYLNDVITPIEKYYSRPIFSPD